MARLVCVSGLVAGGVCAGGAGRRWLLWQCLVELVSRPAPGM